MILHKRIDRYDHESEILFNHKHVIKFLAKHKQFLNDEEAIKVFIMSGKYRLAIQHLKDSGENFNVEYFTIALESNAYDIAFALYAQFED